MKKGVDKWESVWYSNKAVAEVTTSARENSAKLNIERIGSQKTF